MQKMHVEAFAIDETGQQAWRKPSGKSFKDQIASSSKVNHP